jgi:hypothetical protein
MLETLLSSTHGVPTLAIVQPHKPQSMSLYESSKNLLVCEHRLFFVCAHTKQITASGPGGRGYRISDFQQWVKTAAPVLVAGLLAAQIGLAFACVPLPLMGLSGSLLQGGSQPLLQTVQGMVPDTAATAAITATTNCVTDRVAQVGLTEARVPVMGLTGSLLQGGSDSQQTQYIGSLLQTIQEMVPDTSSSPSLATPHTTAATATTAATSVTDRDLDLTDPSSFEKLLPAGPSGSTVRAAYEAIRQVAMPMPIPIPPG